MREADKPQTIDEYHLELLEQVHWLREENGELTKKIRHICWDGCLFPNDVMLQPQTWNDILAAMIEVRDRHGWTE